MKPSEVVSECQPTSYSSRELAKTEVTRNQLSCFGFFAGQRLGVGDRTQTRLVVVEDFSHLHCYCYCYAGLSPHVAGIGGLLIVAY
jgi:hypothetical protein